MLRVIVTSPERVLFDGTARRVIFPGEQGIFEVQILHRSLISRLIGGEVVVDWTSFRIRRGVVRVHQDQVAAVVET